MENKITKLTDWSKKSKVNIANAIILTITTLAMIIWIIAMFTNLGVNGASNDITTTIIGDVIIIPLMAFAALAGVISVAASNNKAPLTLLALSTIATLYKLMYAVVQIIAGQDAINSSLIIGQSISLFTLILQVYFWIKWNKQTNENKFITQAFKGIRSLIAILIIGAVFIIEVSISLALNGENIFAIIMDVSGAMLYTIASVLMAFGNIFCFLFFFLSDINWLYWTVSDMLSTHNALMMAMAVTTFIQVLAYTLLAVTGFIQWFNDDFEIKGLKINRKIRNEKN